MLKLGGQKGKSVITHYKMYKKGKDWICAGIIVVGVSVMNSQLNVIKADNVTNSEVSTVMHTNSELQNSSNTAEKENISNNSTSAETQPVSQQSKSPSSADVKKAANDTSSDSRTIASSENSVTSSATSATASNDSDSNANSNNDGSKQVLDESSTAKNMNSQSSNLSQAASVSNSVSVTNASSTVSRSSASRQSQFKFRIAAASVKVPDTTTGATAYANAAPITSNAKADVPQQGEKLDGKYSFIPKFNGSGTTKVSVIGTPMAAKKVNTIAENLTTATKGQAGFKYTNVGFDATGHSMNLKIVFSDWGRLANVGAAYIEAYQNMIFTNFPGVGWADVKYDFVRSDTGDEEPISGILTLTDIDGSQTVSLTDEQMAAIDKIYIPQSKDPNSGQVDNWLRYKNIAGYTTIVSPKTDSDPTDEYAMLTFAYSNQKSLTFRYSNGFNRIPKMNVWGVNYVAQKPLQTAVVTPCETVSDSDQSNVISNDLKDGESNYTYTFHQTIPDEWPEYYYQNMSITGDLPTNVTLNNYQVADETGKDVTSNFSNQSNGSQLKFVANNNQQAAFYGHYYTLKLNVNANQTDEMQTVKLVLATTIDGDTKAANAVTTTIATKHYLTTHYYLQGTTQSLAPDETVRVIDGSNYQTTPKSIPGYQLASQTNTSGQYSSAAPRAVYQYAPIKINVPTQYVDQNNKKIATDNQIVGDFNSDYNGSNRQLEIQGYQFRKADNLTGKFALANAPVIFHYQAIPETVQIEYVNQNGQSIAPQQAVTGFYADSYDANAKQQTISGYTFANVERVSGKYALNNEPVIFHYNAVPVTIPMEYVDQNGKIIANNNQQQGLYADSYDARPQQQNITGYDWMKTDFSTGQYTLQNAPIVFHYQAIPEAVRVRYLNQNNAEISAASSVAGVYNDPYQTQPISITGYQLVDSSNNVTGQYSLNTPDVIYHYQGLPEQVVVHNIDDWDNDLGGQTISGLYGDSYAITPVQISHWYEVVANKDVPKLQGQFALTPQNVTVHYKQTYNREHYNANYSWSSPVFDGNNQYIGLNQIFANDVSQYGQLDFMRNADGSFRVGLMADNRDESSFNEYHALQPGQQIQYPGAKGTTITVKLSQDGTLQLQHSNNAQFPDGDEITINNRGQVVSQLNQFTNVSGMGLVTTEVGKLSHQTMRETFPNGLTLNIARINNQNVVTVYDKNGQLLKTVNKPFNKNIRINLKNGTAIEIDNPNSQKYQSEILVPTNHGYQYYGMNVTANLLSQTTQAVANKHRTVTSLVRYRYNQKYDPSADYQKMIPKKAGRIDGIYEIGKKQTQGNTKIQLQSNLPLTYKLSQTQKETSVQLTMPKFIVAIKLNHQGSTVHVITHDKQSLYNGKLNDAITIQFNGEVYKIERHGNIISVVDLGPVQSVKTAGVAVNQNGVIHNGDKTDEIQLNISEANMSGNQSGLNNTIMQSSSKSYDQPKNHIGNKRESTAKRAQLPQTNQSDQSWLTAVGISLLGIFSGLFRRKEVK